MLSNDPSNEPAFPMLVIDFNLNHRLLIEHYLSVCIPQVEPVFKSTAEEAIDYLLSVTNRSRRLPKLILMDIYLPLPEAGWQLMKDLREQYPRLPVLILSKDSTADTVLKAYETGAYSFIEKPDTLEGWEPIFSSMARYWLRTVTLPTK